MARVRAAFAAAGYTADALADLLGPVAGAALARRTPLGPHVADAFARTEWLRSHGGLALAGARLEVAPDVAQEQIGDPGAEDPRHVVLRQGTGLRRAKAVDTATAALVGAWEVMCPRGAARRRRRGA